MPKAWWGALWFGRSHCGKENKQTIFLNTWMSILCLMNQPMFLLSWMGIANSKQPKIMCVHDLLDDLQMCIFTLIGAFPSFLQHFCEILMLFPNLILPHTWTKTIMQLTRICIWNHIYLSFSFPNKMVTLSLLCKLICT